MYIKVKSLSNNVYILTGIYKHNSEINITIRLVSRWTGIDEKDIENKIKEYNGYAFMLDVNTDIKIVAFNSYNNAESYSNWLNAYLIMKKLKEI